MKKRALLLVNPSSGTGSIKNGVFDVARELVLNEIEPVLFPILPGDGWGAEDILDVYGNNYDMIICAGGDGTMNHVINGMMAMKDRPPLGYIPTGSTNDFARSIGVPLDTAKAAEAIVHGETFGYDIGSINGEYFNYVAAFGAFTEISYNTNQHFKNIFGHAAYMIKMFLTLPKHIIYKKPVKVTADSFELEEELLFGAVYNATSMGGIDMPGAKNMELNDGKLEMLMIKAPWNPVVELPFVLNCLMNDRVDNKYIIYKQIEYADLEFTEEIPWTNDGEYGGAYRKVRIDVEKQAIDIMLPRDEVEALKLKNKDKNEAAE